jgi:hypothetical protein
MTDCKTIADCRDPGTLDNRRDGPHESIRDFESLVRPACNTEGVRISGNLGVRSRDGVRAFFAREHRSARYDATVHHNQPAMTPHHKTAAGCLKSPASIR